MPSLFDVPGLLTLTVVLGYFELHMTGGGGGGGAWRTPFRSQGADHRDIWRTRQKLCKVKDLGVIILKKLHILLVMIIHANLYAWIIFFLITSEIKLLVHYFWCRKFPRSSLRSACIRMYFIVLWISYVFYCFMISAVWDPHLDQY